MPTTFPLIKRQMYNRSCKPPFLLVLAALSGAPACGTDGTSGGTDWPEAGASNLGGSMGSSGSAGSAIGVAGSAGSTPGASGNGGGAGLAGTAGQSGTGAAGTESGGGNAGASGNGGASGSAGASSSAGSSGTGGGAGSGATSYKPCPTTGDACKILPFGDSITEGVKSSDGAGYRSQLFKLIVAAQQKVTFTGSLSNGPAQVSGQSFPRLHEGHAGWTIDPGYSEFSGYGGISSLVPSPALNGGPHIILLHIGANDLFPTKDGAGMATRLDALVEKLADNAPAALIVLAQITPVGSTNNGHTKAQVDAANAAQMLYNSKMPAIIESHVAKGQHVIGVDMSKMPLSGLTTASVHPNDQGYAYMAGIWYAALKDLLPK
jgi:lysophospholipase L1-like esterase